MSALAQQAAGELAATSGIETAILKGLFEQFEAFFWTEFNKYASIVVYSRKVVFWTITIRLESLREPIANLFNKIAPTEVTAA